MCDLFIFLNLRSCVSLDLMRMFFDVLLDEEVIQDEMFFNWESSADTKTLASVSGFFDWIRKVEQQLSWSRGAPAVVAQDSQKKTEKKNPTKKIFLATFYIFK